MKLFYVLPFIYAATAWAVDHSEVDLASEAVATPGCSQTSCTWRRRFERPMGTNRDDGAAEKECTRFRDLRNGAKPLGKPVIVKFTARWCGPCQAEAKELDELFARSAYSDKFELLHLDIDACPDLAEDFALRSIPVLMKFLSVQQMKNKTPATTLTGYVPGTVENFLD